MRSCTTLEIPGGGYHTVAMSRRIPIPPQTNPEGDEDTFLPEQVTFYHTTHLGCPRTISVHGRQKKEPDLNLLVEALIMIAEERARKQQQDQADDSSNIS